MAIQRHSSADGDRRKLHPPKRPNQSGWVLQCSRRQSLRLYHQPGGDTHSQWWRWPGTLAGISKSSNQVQIAFPTDSGSHYVVQSEPRLNASQWTNASPDIVGTGGLMTFTDFNATGSTRFYRLLVTVTVHAARHHRQLPKRHELLRCCGHRSSLRHARRQDRQQPKYPGESPGRLAFGPVQGLLRFDNIFGSGSNQIPPGAQITSAGSSSPPPWLPATALTPFGSIGCWPHGAPFPLGTPSPMASPR